MSADLIMTGGHALLVESTEHDKVLQYWGKDNCQMDGLRLMPIAACSRAIPLSDHDEYTYYHLVLEDDGNPKRKYGLWANGVLVESEPRSDFLSQNYTLL
jgi:hypothetical protein